MATSRFLGDKESRAALIDLMQHKLRAEYQSYRWVSKESGFPGRVFVIYTLRGGQPTDIEVVTLRAISVSGDGPVVWAASEGQGEYAIEAVPVKWRGRDLFLQVPQEFIFKWCGKLSDTRLEFGPHFAVLIKTRSRELEQIEGDTYCATYNDFRDRFPKVHIEYWTRPALQKE